MASCLKICYYSFRIDGFSKLITTPVRTSQKPEYNITEYSDGRLTLEMWALEIFTVTNSLYQLSL